MVEPKKLAELELRYGEVLALGDEEEPPPELRKRGRPKKTKSRNLLERFKTYQSAVLAFAHHTEVPFTNNLGERD